MVINNCACVASPLNVNNQAMMIDGTGLCGLMKEINNCVASPFNVFGFYVEM